MRKRILISGAGRLACRHAEGLMKSKHPIDLFVYDLSTKQLNVLDEFLSKIKTKNKNITTTFWLNINHLRRDNSHFDMIIVSSTAKNREHLVKLLFDNFFCTFWLIEKPLTQSSAALNSMGNILSNQKVWVNYFRRAVPWHQEIKKLISESGSIQVTAQAQDLGIGCNISHFVDLVMFWTDELPIEVDVSKLQDTWVKSKRPSFFDIKGEVNINFNKGSSLRLISEMCINESLIFGTNLITNKTFKINENDGIACIFDQKPLKGKMLFQSEMTGTLFDELVANMTCKLTPLNEAIKGYGIVIEALGEHWNQNTDGKKLLNIPIT